VKLLRIAVHDNRISSQLALRDDPLLFRPALDEVECPLERRAQIVALPLGPRRNRKIDQTLNRRFHPFDLIENQRDPLPGNYGVAPLV
jgi:hypothetical protein